MLDLFAEERPYCLSYFFEFKALFEVSFDFFAELLFRGLFDVEVVNRFEKIEPDFIDAAEYPDGHSLDEKMSTWKVALTSWIILLTYDSCFVMNSKAFLYF